MTSAGATTRAGTPAGAATARPWRAFAWISSGVFAASLDLFIVNITFPDLQREFSGAGLAELSWVLNGYAVVFAALLVPAGRLADLYGRRRGFVIGMSVFTLASAACAVAPTAGVLIAARVLEGAGAAILTPSSLGVVLPLFPARARSGVVAAWAAIGALGAAAGPPIGGLLVQSSWRWVFVVNLPLGLVAICYALLRLRESRDPHAAGLPDVLGTVALMLGIGSLTLALAKGREWGWADPSTLTAFTVALLAGTAAVVRSARHRVPVLELRLLRIPSFALAVTSALAFFAAFATLLLAGVLFLTQVWGHSILRAGLELAPGPLTALLGAVVAGRLGPRYGMSIIGALGGILVAAANAWSALMLGPDPEYLSRFLPGQLAGGLGVGLAMPAFTAVAVAAVGPARFSTAIGISQMFRQVGGALGVAAFVAIVGSPARGAAVAAFHHGWWFCMTAATLGGLLMLAVRFVPRPAPAEDGTAVPDRASVVADPVP